MIFIVLSVLIRVLMFAGTFAYCVHRRAWKFAILMLACIFTGVAYYIGNPYIYTVLSNVSSTLMCFLIVRRLGKSVREDY